jgi:hypothetical protein
MRRLLVRWSVYVGAGALAASLLALGAPNVASACACGGIVSTDISTRVADEVALVTMDGRDETVVMRLNLQSTADNAALIVPTPTAAQVSLASPKLFDELETLTAPRVETRRQWSFGAQAAANDGLAARGAPQGPTVVNQVQLGPLEATTLAGGEVSSVQEWLAAHDYTMRPEVVAQLGPYLKRGWAFVAMRLTGPTPLNGRLAPVKLTFGSEKIVYPMRMSAAAHDVQRVVVYTLGAHRMQRTDDDAATQHTEIDYAGSVAGRSDDPTLSEMDDHGAFLTRMSVQINEPASITSDFEFGPAPTDAPFQRVIYRDETRDVTPIVFGGGLVVIVAVLGVVLLAVRRRRSSLHRP